MICRVKKETNLPIWPTDGRFLPDDPTNTVEVSSVLGVLMAAADWWMLSLCPGSYLLGTDLLVVIVFVFPIILRGRRAVKLTLGGSLSSVCLSPVCVSSVCLSSVCLSPVCVSSVCLSPVCVSSVCLSPVCVSSVCLSFVCLFCLSLTCLCLFCLSLTSLSLICLSLICLSLFCLSLTCLCLFCLSLICVSLLSHLCVSSDRRVSHLSVSLLSVSHLSVSHLSNPNPRRCD